MLKFAHKPSNAEIDLLPWTDSLKFFIHLYFFSLLQVKDIYLHPEQFTIENGLLTPTLKAKRAELKTLFQPQINQLYANMSWTQ